jgi:hypothetical protein
MLQVQVKNDALVFGDGFMVSFERTLRIPDDGKNYPLPPSLGRFPILKVEDYAKTVPEEWAKHGGVFIPMYQREAMWLRFGARHWKPNAVKIAVGKVNAVSGKAWEQKLSADKEDYMVCPPQPWLDGINAGDGLIKQFVAMPLGMGYTVEAQVTGKEDVGGLQIIVYEAKPGKFPDKPPDTDERFVMRAGAMPMAAPPPMASAVLSAPKAAEMGLAAGGKMKQKIYPDKHGIDTWDENNFARVFVHIVNSMAFRDITGKELPPTPVSAQLYAKHNLPWFDLYDDHLSDIGAPDELKNVKSVKEMDEQKGFKPQQDDSSVDTPNIVTYKVDKDGVKDGEW